MNHINVTFYNDKIHPDVPKYQKMVFDHFNIPITQIKSDDWKGHGQEIDNYISEWIKHSGYNDTISIWDIDCIPTNILLLTIRDHYFLDGVSGVSQKASHIISSKDYIGPSYIIFSKKTFERLGKPSFKETETTDVGGFVTNIAKERGVYLNFYYPTHVEEPLWKLDNGQMFGKGTTYENGVYHAFLSRKGNHEMFIKKCKEVLGQNEQEM